MSEPHDPDTCLACSVSKPGLPMYPYEQTSARTSVSGLLRVIAQEAWRIGALSGSGDPDSSPWCDRQETTSMAEASARLRVSFQAKVEPYRPILTAWLDEHDREIRATANTA